MEPEQLAESLLSATNNNQISSVLGPLTTDQLENLTTALLPNGHTLLHLLAQREKLNALRRVLMRGVGCKARNAYGVTPLHLAMHHNCLNSARVLIEVGGANPSEVISRRKGTTLLHLMVACGRTQAVQLLLEHEVEVNARDKKGRTPLHLAAIYGNLQVTATLLSHKQCDVNAYSDSGYNALMLSILNNNHEVAKLLADWPDVDILLKDLHLDQSPLHLAVCRGQLYVVRALLHRNSANLHCKEKVMGRAAIHLACALTCSSSGLVTSNFLLGRHLLHRKSLTAHSTTSRELMEESESGELERLLCDKTLSATKLLSWLQEQESHDPDLPSSPKQMAMLWNSSSHNFLSVKKEHHQNLFMLGTNSQLLISPGRSHPTHQTERNIHLEIAQQGHSRQAKLSSQRSVQIKVSQSSGQTIVPSQSSGQIEVSSHGSGLTISLPRGSGQSTVPSHGSGQSIVPSHGSVQTIVPSHQNEKSTGINSRQRSRTKGFGKKQRSAKCLVPKQTSGRNRTEVLTQTNGQVHQNNEIAVVHGYHRSSTTRKLSTAVPADVINGNVLMESTSSSVSTATPVTKQSMSRQQDMKNQELKSSSALKTKCTTSNVCTSTRLLMRHSISGDSTSRSQQSISRLQRQSCTVEAKTNGEIRPATAPACNRPYSFSSTFRIRPDRSKQELTLPSHVNEFRVVTPLTIDTLRIRMVSLLLEYGADANLMTTFRKTALHIAVMMGSAGVSELLLPHITNVNVLTQHNKTALHLAVERGHTAVVEMLLHAGGNTALRDAAGMTPLHKAARLGLQSIVLLLVHAGAAINCSDFRLMTPLHYACQYQHQQVAQVLLDAGARVDMVDAHEKTALDYSTSMITSENFDSLELSFLKKADEGTVSFTTLESNIESTLEETGTLEPPSLLIP